MFIERKIDLSIFYRIKELFEDYPSITITEEYPMGEVEVPTISIESDDITVVPYQLGTRRGLDFKIWHIEIWAKNRTQRDDFAYLIKNGLQDGIPVYDFGDEDTGYNFDNPPQMGAMAITELSVEPKAVLAQLASKFNWRTKVTITAYYNSSS